MKTDCPDCQRLARKLKRRRKADKASLIAAALLLVFSVGILAGVTAAAGAMKIRAAAAAKR